MHHVHDLNRTRHGRSVLLTCTQIATRTRATTSSMALRVIHDGHRQVYYSYLWLSIATSTMDTICARTMDGTKSTRGASSELSNARVAGRCEGQIANLESAHTHSRYESKAIRELWRTSRGNPAGLGSETTLFEQSTAILFLSQIPQRQWRLTGPRLPHGTFHITTCRRWAFGLATSIDSCLTDGCSTPCRRYRTSMSRHCALKSPSDILRWVSCATANYL